jgi:hypothetical protein
MFAVLCVLYWFLSICCWYYFCIVPSVYSSVYFVLFLVYPMLSVSLCCSFLIVPSVYSSVYFVLCLVYPMSKQKEQHRDTDSTGYTRHKTK